MRRYRVSTAGLPIDQFLGEYRSFFTFVETELTSIPPEPGMASEIGGMDPGYGRGVPFCAFYFSGQGSLARVTPLFLCDFTYSSCFSLAKLIRNAKVI